MDDLSTSLQEKEFLDVKPADELLEHPGFQFLQDWGLKLPICDLLFFLCSFKINSNSISSVIAMVIVNLFFFAPFFLLFLVIFSCPCCNIIYLFFSFWNPRGINISQVCIPFSSFWFLCFCSAILSSNSHRGVRKHLFCCLVAEVLHSPTLFLLYKRTKYIYKQSFFSVLFCSREFTVS